MSIDKEKIREIGASVTPDPLFFHHATNCHLSSHAAPTPLLRLPEKKERSCLPGAIACPKSKSIMHAESKSIACPSLSLSHTLSPSQSWALSPSPSCIQHPELDDIDNDLDKSVSEQ